MSITVTYPGIYVTEDASPSFSVGNAPTAVPVFIGDFYTHAEVFGSSSRCTRISSWLDFCSKYSTGVNLQVIVEVVSMVSSSVSEIPMRGNMRAAEDYTYDIMISNYGNDLPSIKLYFQNGGGGCYVLNDGGDEMLAAIECESDITMLVGLTSDCVASLNTLLMKDKGYFAITASSSGTDVPPTRADQTAVYYPPLISDYCGTRRPDASLSVAYIDIDGSISNMTMADLKTKDPEAYELASTAVDSYLTQPTFVSPEAAIAGIYCTTDVTRGVWKAPANVVVKGVTGVQTLVTDDQQGDMNNKGINVIRYFPDRGVVVWGARTLAGTSSNNDTSWRYIPVRRLFNSAERDIKQALQLMVFEPNNEPTWEKVRSAIENYLHNLWRQGALVGTTTAEAYFVQIGLNVTMSEEQVAAGQMIATVGMAAVRPAEFIILQFTQNMSV